MPLNGRLRLPASRPRRISSRLNQRTSSSSWSEQKISPAANSAVKPSIREPGKGHGWEAKYSTEQISMPASSRTSRRTASSRVSPGSTKPARTEYIPSGQLDWRAIRQSSPRQIRMITAGSVRGKCCVPQAGRLQTRRWPPSRLTVGAPQTPQ